MARFLHQRTLFTRRKALIGALGRAPHPNASATDVWWNCIWTTSHSDFWQTDTPSTSQARYASINTGGWAARDFIADPTDGTAYLFVTSPRQQEVTSWTCVPPPCSPLLLTITILANQKCPYPVVYPPSPPDELALILCSRTHNTARLPFRW